MMLSESPVKWPALMVLLAFILRYVCNASSSGFDSSGFEISMRF